MQILQQNESLVRSYNYVLQEIREFFFFSCLRKGKVGRPSLPDPIKIENFTKYTRKDLCRGLFFNKVAGLKPELQTLSKKRYCTGIFF